MSKLYRGLHNRRVMNQARRTRYFARSAKRVRSAKCRVRLAWLTKRLSCRLARSSSSCRWFQASISSSSKEHFGFHGKVSSEDVCVWVTSICVFSQFVGKKVLPGGGALSLLTVLEWHFIFIFRQESPVLSLSFHLPKSSLLKSKYTQLNLKWSKRGFNFLKERPLLLFKT